MSDDERVRGRRALCKVDYVRDAACLFEGLDDADRFGGNRLLRLVCRSAYVMRAVKIRLFHNLVCELACCRRWLCGENIQPRANPASLQSVLQRRLIYDLAARSVDEDCAFLHRVENVRADERARLRL